MNIVREFILKLRIAFPPQIMPQRMYAVARGRQTGVFTTWAECKAQVDGFPYPRFKKFSTRAEAEQFIRDESERIHLRNYYPVITSEEDNTRLFQAKNDVPKNRKRKHNSISTTTMATTSSSASTSITTSVLSSSSSTTSFVTMDRSGREIPVVYTDGACKHNGRNTAKAGYGVFWGDGHPDNVSACIDGVATNNRAEYTAINTALRQAKERGHTDICVRTDSQLIVRSMTEWLPKWKHNNWTKADGTPVLNKDLIVEMDGRMRDMNVTFEHVRGHNGDYGNEMADRLACEGVNRK